MARRRVQKDAAVPKIQFSHPDRSGPDPSQETLLDLAAQRGLLNTTSRRDGEHVEDLDPPIGRVGESVLWGISLAMLHFTFDVLVQHQYAVGISWPKIISESMRAFIVFFLLVYLFHPHPIPSGLLPNSYANLQPFLHNFLFFSGSIATGCYLIYVTNDHGYYAVMKTAPSLGCLWIWCVIELDLLWAVGSLLACLTFLWIGGFSYF